MPANPPPIPILQLRGLAVILDADLARLYGATTKRLNEQVKRNSKRFPPDFRFRLTTKELSTLWSQIATTNPQVTDSQLVENLKSQFATPKRGGRRTLPWAFTEHGALMASNVLNSPEAVKMSVFIIRAFIKQRELLTANATILRRLAEIDRTLLLHDSGLRDVYQKLLPLLQPPPDPPKRRIGFHP